MDERAILRMQTTALLDQLDQAEWTLARGQEIERRLYDSVHVGFEQALRSQRETVKALLARIQEGDPAPACWPTFTEVQEACHILFQETLNFIGGSAMRRAGLDDGMCCIADALLAELSRQADIGWGRFTILANSEFYTEMAQIVRLRFPEPSIWNLPIAAHEFGHFIGPQLEEIQANGARKYPFQQLLETARLDGKRAARDPSVREQLSRQYFAHLHERFADLFAVYTLGPAYACACLLLRFDPATAHLEGRDHPTTAQRAHWILAALKRMNQAEGIRQPYLPLIQALEQGWQQSLDAVGDKDALAATLEPGIVKVLDDLLNTLYNLINQHQHLLNARYSYDGWLRALRLATALQPDQRHPPQLQDGDALRDIINAAWLCRLQLEESQHADPRQLQHVGQVALRLCKQQAGC